jgi:hypothetical protein
VIRTDNLKLLARSCSHLRKSCLRYFLWLTQDVNISCGMNLQTLLATLVRNTLLSISKQRTRFMTKNITVIPTAHSTAPFNRIAVASQIVRHLWTIQSIRLLTSGVFSIFFLSMFHTKWGTYRLEFNTFTPCVCVFTYVYPTHFNFRSI